MSKRIKSEPSLELIRTIAHYIKNRGLNGITSVACGFGRLEQMLATDYPQFNVIGIENRCSSEFDGTVRKYKHIIVDFDEERIKNNPEAFKWMDTSIVYSKDEIYLPVEGKNGLLFSHSISSVPWRLYVENYLQNQGSLIFILESNDNSSPSAFDMVEKLKDMVGDWHFETHVKFSQNPYEKLTVFYREDDASVSRGSDVNQ